MSIKKLTVILMMLLAVPVVCACTDYTQKYDCTFNRINGKFITTRHELVKDGALIMVVGQDGRSHAFSRNSLQVCRER